MIVIFKFRLCSSYSVWRCLLQLGCTHFIICSSHISTHYSLKHIVWLYQTLKSKLSHAYIRTKVLIWFYVYLADLCISILQQYCVLVGLFVWYDSEIIAIYYNQYDIYSWSLKQTNYHELYHLIVVKTFITDQNFINGTSSV